MLSSLGLTRLLCALLAGYALHATLRERRLTVRRVDCPYRHLRNDFGQPILDTYDEFYGPPERRWGRYHNS
jgi:hypothetical protein